MSKRRSLVGASAAVLAAIGLMVSGPTLANAAPGDVYPVIFTPSLQGSCQHLPDAASMVATGSYSVTAPDGSTSQGGSWSAQFGTTITWNGIEEGSTLSVTIDPLRSPGCTWEMPVDSSVLIDASTQYDARYVLSDRDFAFYQFTIVPEATGSCTALADPTTVAVSGTYTYTLFDGSGGQAAPWSGTIGTPIPLAMFPEGTTITVTHDPVVTEGCVWQVPDTVVIPASASYADIVHTATYALASPVNPVDPVTPAQPSATEAVLPPTGTDVTGLLGLAALVLAAGAALQVRRRASLG